MNLGTVFTGLTIGGAVLGGIGSVGGAMYTKHQQNLEFNARMGAMEHQFNSRFSDDRWNDSIDSMGEDPQ